MIDFLFIDDLSPRFYHVCPVLSKHHIVYLKIIPPHNFPYSHRLGLNEETQYELRH